MSDRSGPRFAVNTSNSENTGNHLPDREYSASTYGAAADALAELRQCIEQFGAAVREGRI
ncbi:hypothetical protein [Pseudonocardia sp. H11422]|uniref:hypothetical protein n=1 Tax=Pseudonocardia sp. H11422 TaxID=2835866 RepID=UPI001BDDA953|nr:hypothetical protein [Pseudonocardia sp. H11422]